MGAESNQAVEEIRNTRLQRLALLKRRQSIEGFRVDPSVVIEIVQTQRELGIADDVVSHPADVAMAEELGAGGRFLALDSRIERIDQRLDERMDRFELAIEKRLDRMEEHSVTRYESQEAKHDSGSQLYRFLFILLSLGVTFALVLCAFLIGGAFR
jgi:hypothetical protein